jgi:hypothetical protein
MPATANLCTTSASYADIDIPESSNRGMNRKSAITETGSVRRIGVIFNSADDGTSGMAKFEHLPENVRALILAKLAAELAAHKSADLHELARMQRTNVAHAWRDICRKAGQPACTIPADVMQGN